FKFHIDWLAGMQIGRDLRIEYRFDHEDEFRAAFPAVDDRRRVFRVRRDVTDLTNERIWHAVNGHLSRIAVVDRTNLRFGDERAHFNVLRRQQRDHRFPRRYPFALAKKRVINQTGHWRRLSFLVEIPLCLSNALPVLVAGGTRAIVILRGSWTHAEKLFLSGELSFGKDQRRPRHIERRFLGCFIQSEEWIAD